MANLSAELSKDENTHIGAFIIGTNGEPVSWGYNGTVSGFPDNYIPHSREIKSLSYIKNGKEITLESNKYPFMCHAESNAIFYADNNSKLVGSTIYVNAMPCKSCALEIARAKIAKVVVNNSIKPNGGIVGKDDDIAIFIFAVAKIELIIDGINQNLSTSYTI